jgi:CubicO group peptidase (beta-lactamase class C family)
MHRRPLFAAAVAALLAQSALPAPAQTSAPTIDDAVAAIRAYAPIALAEQGAPGMSVTITDTGHTIAVITAGFADVASQTPVTENTRFPIGSISKSMTALALLRLHDRGLVDLNAPVTTYLPWWKLGGATKPILVHELLSHTAGVPDDFTYAATGFALAALRGAPQLFPAGTAWSYSNDGYATVGEIVAARSGSSWQDAIERSVFAPLGMNASSAVFTPALMSDVATGYLIRDTDVALPTHPALMPAQKIDFVDAAGSVISTPHDMAAYVRFYLNGGKADDGTQLLAPATFAAMTNADSLANGKPAGAARPELDEWPEFYTQYGFGLGIFHTNGDHLIGHTGGISGYTACMQANLTRGFGVIAMSNLVEAPLHPCQIVKYAMAVLRAQRLGEPLPKPPEGPPIPAPVVKNADYTGTYQGRDRAVVVSEEGGRLVLADGGKNYQLQPNGDDLFWTDDPALPVYFVAFGRNGKGAVDSFTSGSRFFAGAQYAGPKHWASPPGSERLAGRYEGWIWGSPLVVRIVVVKGQLTVDGIQPLVAKGGVFRLGHSTVRFDTPAAGKMQRMWIDGGDLYRVELP